MYQRERKSPRRAAACPDATSQDCRPAGDIGYPRLDAAHRGDRSDTIAKFLLTSGSTGNPKAVINTQRMICANQVMLRETLAFLKD